MIVIKKSVLLMALALLLSSCATTSNVDLNIKAGSVVNLSRVNGKSPIAVTVYQLGNVQAFCDASYDELTTGNVAGILQQQTWIIWPNQEVSKKITLDPNAKAIGVIAAYRHMQGKRWKSVYTWSGWSHSIKITINNEGIKE